MARLKHSMFSVLVSNAIILFSILIKNVEVDNGLMEYSIKMKCSSTDSLRVNIGSLSVEMVIKAKIMVSCHLMSG